jgi:hypothetical protein
VAESDAVAPTAIAVHRGAWNLPPDVAAMVAPPIVVSAAPVAPSDRDLRRLAQVARLRGNMPAGRHRRTTPPN